MKINGNVAIFEVQTRFADGNANLCNTDIIHLIEQMFCMKKKIYQFFFAHVYMYSRLTSLEFAQLATEFQSLIPTYSTQKEI